MTLFIQQQNVQIEDKEKNISQIYLRDLECIQINNLKETRIELPERKTAILFTEKKFQGDYVQLFSSQDWIILDKIGSIMYRDSPKNIALIKFQYQNNTYSFGIPQGLYTDFYSLNLPLKDIGLTYKDIQIQLLKKEGKIEYYEEKGFQVLKKDCLPVAHLGFPNIQINLYAHTKQFAIIHQLFSEDFSINIIDKTKKLVLFEKRFFCGQIININDSVDKFLKIGNIGSLQIQKIQYTDMFMDILKISIYGKTEPLIVLVLFISILMIILLKIILISIDKKNKKKETNRLMYYNEEQQNHQKQEGN